MKPTRREFMKAAGLSAGMALAGRIGVARAQLAGTTDIATLKQFFADNAAPRVSMPPTATSRPRIGWAGPLTKSVPATTLPDGIVVPVGSPLIGGALRHRYVNGLAGNPLVSGLPCPVIRRTYQCRGIPRTTSSVTSMRFRTDAPVVELSGVTVDGASTCVTLIVDGELVPPVSLSSGMGLGGWNIGTLRIDFGSRRVRDVWLESSAATAFLKIGRGDEMLPADDAAEPQLTVVGDSYLLSRSASFGNGGAIALEVGARLGIRKVATDAIGGTGYRNTGGSLGNLNDRLPGHAADNSSIYLVMAGINDYGDMVNATTLDWGTRAAYEAAVRNYLLGLRAAQPGALIVVTAPFCPIPSLSDATYAANPAVNNSGVGDYLFKALAHRSALQLVAGPWIYIDVLMGGGWNNSSGASGDVTNLQWLTGGTPGPGTSATFKPGNTGGGGGGGHGGILRVPVLSGGQYRQAPELTVCGGTGSGLLLASSITRAGALSSVMIACDGHGYTSGAGLPRISIDSTHEVVPAVLGAPVLRTGINPEGMYPLPSFAPPGTRPEQLNNVYFMLHSDTIHPSPLGVEYLAARLARSIHDGVMAL